MPADLFDLQRFVDAQRAQVDDVRDELARGRKVTHWMWYVFPQLAGLGHSPMAQRYALSGPEEARAYLDHPVLGPRLLGHVEQLLALQGRSAREIFGWPDVAKLQSCLTLFALARPAEARFQQALDRYYDGARDPATVSGLASLPPARG
jgi:uncharacterized protein (DUF1810 family)